jgi:hypothetical protein
MKAIEVWRNGEKLFTAGLEKGIVTARLIIRNQVDPIRFDVVGRDSLTVDMCLGDFTGSKPATNSH